MHEITLTELFAYRDTDDETKALVIARARELGATHIVLFVNLLMDSSSFGASSFVMCGPGCTYKSPADCEGKHLNDLPSQRQYPEVWARVGV